MVFSMGVHVLFYPYDEHSRALQRFTKLTKISELSLSLAYDDSTFNASYPEMPALGRMDFVYER